MKRRWSGG